jgi:hypothetical protein
LTTPHQLLHWLQQQVLNSELVLQIPPLVALMMTHLTSHQMKRMTSHLPVVQQHQQWARPYCVELLLGRLHPIAPVTMTVSGLQLGQPHLEQLHSDSAVKRVILWMSVQHLNSHRHYWRSRLKNPQLKLILRQVQRLVQEKPQVWGRQLNLAERLQTRKQ